MSSNKQKIALVDDNVNILTSVAIALENEGYEITTYSDGNIALEDFAAQSPDLVILDIKMPQIDGYEILKKLRSFSQVPVLFLTSKDEEMDEILALKLGGDDFVKKPFSQRLLLERIRTLLRRFEANNKEKAKEQDKSQEVRVGDLLLNKAKHLCLWKDKEINLTATEFNILYVLAEHPGVVKTRDAMLDLVYRDQNFVDDRSIDSHIRRLRKKFKDVDDNFNLIETLYGVGYRFDSGKTA